MNEKFNPSKHTKLPEGGYVSNEAIETKEIAEKVADVLRRLGKEVSTMGVLHGMALGEDEK
jgi:hypothetical protein